MDFSKIEADEEQPGLAMLDSGFEPCMFALRQHKWWHK